MVIGQQMPQLRDLFVGGTRIATTGLGAILNGCRRLSTLCIDSCQQLTDADIALVAQCSELGKLHVTRTAITATTLEVIVRSCTHLAVVDVRSAAVLGCHAPGERAADALSQAQDHAVVTRNG